MIVKKAGGKVYGAVFTAAEKKAMEMEINRQIIEADKRYTDDIDAMVLYTLAVHLGFGPKRLRRFYEAFAAEHDRLIQHYEMPDDYTWLCKEELKKIGVDVEAWNREREVFMTFVNNNGKVPYIMVAGADHVTGEMPLETAEKIYSEGAKRASNRFPGYPVCVDNKYFFAIKTSPKKRKTTNE